MFRLLLRNWRLTTLPDGLELSLHALVPFIMLADLALSGEWPRLVFWLLIHAAALLHSLAHYAMTKILRESPELLRLYPCFSVYRLAMPASSIRNDILITSAGPLANLGLALVLWSIPAGPSGWQTDLMQISTVYGLLTLVPIYPMDGSRLMRLLLNSIFGFDRSIEYANFVSQAVAAGVIIWCFYNGYIFYGFLAIFLYLASKLAPLFQRATLAMNKHEMLVNETYDEETDTEMVVLVENQSGVWEQASRIDVKTSPEPKLFF